MAGEKATSVNSLDVLAQNAIQIRFRKEQAEMHYSLNYFLAALAHGASVRHELGKANNTEIRQNNKPCTGWFPLPGG